MAHMVVLNTVRDADPEGSGGSFGAGFGAAAAEPPGLNLNDPAVLRCLLEQTPTPTALLEGEAGLCSFSNAAFRALGVVAGAPLTSQFPAVSSSLLAAARRGGAQREAAARDGDRFWEVRATPMMGVNGLVRALIVTVEETPDSAAEQERHMRELSHRVKNTLQLVSSLLTLQTLGSKDPEVRRALQSAGGRIGIVTQAHQRTHAALRGDDLDVAGHLRDLCGELEATLPGARRIRVEAEPTSLPVDSVIPLSLIVNELVGNAAKHAYGPDEPGGIEVSLGRAADGRRRLVVSDQGRGLPDGLDVARAATLGLKMVRAFAGQLKGVLRAETGQAGTRLIVELPG
ncbi:sensor histidine kinase [Azospirillum agricola]|uniref:sensor histidine kinase n=1 Tax=Azospirillum agricola TaxID=1720247 RepID=UPI000A0F230F|nr:sensor histidine kinase [Azospirillum agricola]SMH61886.1 Two-component sensor histidine kinase, contains HisKA and HATPase domains [Azospirillum lipoferum]